MSGWPLMGRVIDVACRHMVWAHVAVLVRDAFLLEMGLDHLVGVMGRQRSDNPGHRSGGRPKLGLELLGHDDQAFRIHQYNLQKLEQPNLWPPCTYHSKCIDQERSRVSLSFPTIALGLQRRGGGQKPWSAIAWMCYRVCDIVEQVPKKDGQ